MALRMEERERIAHLEAVAGGDADALQCLLVHYHARLRRALAARMDARFDRYFAPEDVLQDAYVSAFKCAADGGFRDDGGFYAWLETIALNALRDRCRALRRQKRDVGRRLTHTPAAASSYSDFVQRLVSPGSTPSRKLAKAEAAAAVLSGVARLSDDQRAVVRMRFLEGRAVADIAAALGKTDPAIHMLTHRALKRLRELLVSFTRHL